MKHKWYSIKDILPPHNKEVLCYVDAERFTGCELLTLLKNDVWEDSEYEKDRLDVVTHWMFLPDKPLAESTKKHNNKISK